MCGIVAFTELGEGRRVDSNHLQKTIELTQYRGPDQSSSLIFDGIGFGHNLLSISAKNYTDAVQPIESHESIVCFNGEIYNFCELRDFLLAKSRNIVSDCDSEIFSKGIDLEGFDFLNRIRGCWAFVFYSKVDKKLYFGRDSYGEKQLLFNDSGDNISVSTEAKSIFYYRKIKPKINLERIKSDLVLDFFASRKDTYYKGVQNCKPGRIYCYSTISRTLEISQDLNWMNNLVYGEHLDLSILKSLNRMIPENKDYGIVLSGGLDSSILASYISKMVNDKKIALTAYYNGGGNADLEYSRLLAQVMPNIDLNEVAIFSDNMQDDIKRVQHHLEEPLYDHVYLSQFKIYQWFKNHNFKVVLNGQASDEFWGGYYHSYKLKSVYNSPSIDMLYTHFFKKSMNGNLTKLFTSREIEDVIDKNLNDFSPSTSSNDNLTTQFIVDRHLQAMLAHEDRLSAASSVEVRLPFLDSSVVGNALSISDKDKIVNGVEKYPLRNSVSGVVPEFIRNRPKQAFPDAPTEFYLQSMQALKETSGDGLFNTTKLGDIDTKLEWKLLAVNHFSLEI